MQYKFERIKVDNDFIYPMITLPDEYAIYEDLLETDIREFDIWFTPLIKKVMRGKSQIEEISGNVGHLVIKPDFCTFYSVFEEDYDGCKMKTEQLYDIILHWKKFLKSSSVYEEYNFKGDE